MGNFIAYLPDYQSILLPVVRVSDLHQGCTRVLINTLRDFGSNTTLHHFPVLTLCFICSIHWLFRWKVSRKVNRAIAMKSQTSCGTRYGVF